MSDQHTKGRIVVLGEWLVPKEHESRLIGGSTNKAQDRNEYAHSIALVRGKYQDDAANARRLAACWNAFDSVRIEMIELVADEDAMLSACNSMSELPIALSELAAARALLREAMNAGDIVESFKVQLKISNYFTSMHSDQNIRSYLDASDKQGGA